jgi:hypothetical protein
MADGVSDEVITESVTEYCGFVNPEAEALKKTVWPTLIDEPGDREFMETVGGPETTSCSETLAVLPDWSDKLTVRLCVPTSEEVGIQVKTPFELTFPLEILLPESESATLYEIKPLKPEERTLKVTSLPILSFVPGDNDCMLADPSAKTDEKGKVSPTKTKTKLVNQLRNEIVNI